MTITRADRIRGGIWGLLVGDALGVPYEFHAPHDVPPADAIDFAPPTGYRRAHSGVPPGTWSDDGAHALCLLASLLHRDGLDPDDLMRRLTNWYECGYLAVDGIVFDVGVQTSRALAAFRSGVPALESGPSGEGDNGNGSLMRVLPLALWHRGTDEQLVADAHRQSRITHGHPRAQVCCALYSLVARRLLDGASNPWSGCVTRLREIYGDSSPERRELDFHVRPDDEGAVTGSGYVVDCLRSARHVLGAGSYSAVVRAAVSLGNDTDTTACVAGGLAGVRDGVNAIPEAWRSALRESELFVPLIDQLLRVDSKGSA